MGKFFVMSKRFDKTVAADFELTPIDDTLAVNSLDGSVWHRAQLYDFGWGKENGYYKLPALNFEQLINLVLGENEDDCYGAAAVILDQYSDKLLSFCEEKIKDEDDVIVYNKIVEIFRLENATNRCSIINKTNEQITNDWNRWKEISNIVVQSKKEIHKKNNNGLLQKLKNSLRKRKI